MVTMDGSVLEIGENPPVDTSTPSKTKPKSQCETCGKSFSSVSNVKAHIRLVHGDGAKYRCGVCRRGFNSPALLHAHENSHLNVS